MTKAQWGILGGLAVAVLCVFSTLVFLVVRDMRRDLATPPPVSVPATASAVSQTATNALLSPTPVAGQAAAPSGALPADPVAATEKIQSQAQSIQSAHITLDFALQVHATPAASTTGPDTPFPERVKVSAEGDYVNHGANQAPDLHLTAHVEMPGETHTAEIVQVGGQQWVNTDGKWEENKDFSPQSANGSTDITTNPLSALLAMQAMGNVEHLPDDSIDGVSTVHYRFSVDPQKLLSSKEMNSGPVNGGMLAALFQDLTVQVEMWADQEHLWLRQEKLLFQAKMTAPSQDDQPVQSLTIRLDGLLKLSHINEPVDIKLPDVKGP